MYIDTNMVKFIVFGNVTKVVVAHMNHGESYSAKNAHPKFNRKYKTCKSIEGQQKIAEIF